MADIPTIINNLLTIIVWPLFLGFVILMFIFAGYMFLSAAGDPGKIATARKAVLWAIIGIIIALVGFSITNIITNILGVAPQGAGGGGWRRRATAGNRSVLFWSTGRLYWRT